MQIIPLKLMGPPLDFMSEDEISFQMRSQLVNLIKIYFDFTYYLCATPFRLVKDKEMRNGLYYRKTWKPQQVVCAILNILLVFRLISNIRETVPESRKSPVLKNPILYFDFALAFCHLFYKGIMIKRFWFNGQLYLKVVNVILREKYLPVTNKWFLRSNFLYAVYGFFTMKIVISLVGGYGFVVPVSKWSPSWWLRRLVATGRFVFCFSSVDSTLETPEFEEMTMLDGFVAGLMFFTYVSRFVMAEFSDLYISIFAITLWTTSKCFADDIQQINKFDEDPGSVMVNSGLPRQLRALGFDTYCNGKGQSQSREQVVWFKIYNNFQAIQTLSEAVNVANGSLVTWFLAEGLMYYSTHLNAFFLTKDLLKKFTTVGFLASTCVNVYFAADFCNQMEAAKSWLVKKNNIKKVPFDEAFLVLHEDITKDVGMRGSDLFTITFELMAEYLSLIVTFFIICVQETDKESV